MTYIIDIFLLSLTHLMNGRVGNLIGCRVWCLSRESQGIKEIENRTTYKFISPVAEGQS